MDKEDNEAIQFEKENNYEDGNAGSENSEQIEQTNVENENSKHTEQAKKKRGRATAKKVEPTKEAKPEPTPITISELEEIAKKATSFENFAKLVAEWLETDRRQDFFTNLVIVSAEVDKITWKGLEKALKDKNVVYTQWDKTWSGQQVSKKLKEYSATMLSFLNATKQYKEYSFKKANVHFIEENSTEQITEQTKPNIEEKVGKSDESIIPKTRVKMECMPEIQDFEEILARVDKTQPVEERVRYVLGAMELNKIPVEEQKKIVEFASTAVKQGKMDFDIIFVEANIPIEQKKAVRMALSQFINNFAQKYEGYKKVKVLDFLSELQKIIMFDSEIKNFSEFNN